MEASMCGLDRYADRPGIRTAGRRRSTRAERHAEESTQEHGRTQPAVRSQAGRFEHALLRVEHALFALILGCVGFVWLGALLAEAAQAL